ncbi:MAG: hypothetical protein Q7T12_00645 [Flavobacterium sp.]|nr:hypothetical protein [Flavobacterium sp.]
MYYSSKIDNGGGKIILTDPFISFKIQKDKSSDLFIKGNLRIIPQLGGNNPLVIQMGVNSKFRINGDFQIGQGVRFILESNSTLTIGGKEKESASGITADTLIMVSKNIEIGKDFICAWNVFISDSDWHSIGGQSHQTDVIIGDHVWIANSCSILKGAIISENCIVASHSKVTNKKFPKNSLLAGAPAHVLKTDISWSRDIAK